MVTADMQKHVVFEKIRHAEQKRHLHVGDIINTNDLNDPDVKNEMNNQDTITFK